MNINDFNDTEEWASQHCTHTTQQAALTEAEVVLFVQDTTELDYTHQVKTQNESQKHKKPG